MKLDEVTMLLLLSLEIELNQELWLSKMTSRNSDTHFDPFQLMCHVLFPGQHVGHWTTGFCIVLYFYNILSR